LWAFCGETPLPKIGLFLLRLPHWGASIGSLEETGNGNYNCSNRKGD